MDKDSCVYEIETDDFYKDIAKNIKARFDTSGYSKDDNRPLLIGKNKNFIGMMKDEPGGKILNKFVALKGKKYAYQKIDKRLEDKCRKSTKKYIIAEILTLITVRPLCLTVKQDTESKCFLKIRIRSTRCTW